MKATVFTNLRVLGKFLIESLGGGDDYTVTADDAEEAAGDAPTKEEFDAVVALANETKEKYNALVAQFATGGE